MTTKLETTLASEGGPKAVTKLGPYPSKLGREELWELVDLWELSPDNKQRIKEMIEHDPHVEGPHLFRYYNPKPSRVAAAEDAMRELIGTKYCLAVNSCTSALIAAYRALGIGAGDEVIVPAYTFFASAAGVVAANGIPVIAEVDNTLTLDPEAAERALTRRTKAIVVVHMRGAAGQMDALVDLAQRKGLPLVEDVAQAGGGSFHGKRLGSLGAAGCFSGCQELLHCLFRLAHFNQGRTERLMHIGVMGLELDPMQGHQKCFATTVGVPGVFPRTFVCNTN
jgi:hypothetical protein